MRAFDCRIVPVPTRRSASVWDEANFGVIGRKPEQDFTLLTLIRPGSSGYQEVMFLFIVMGIKDNLLSNSYINNFSMALIS